jgi:peptidoglycan/LPS O-acetylase OafA/YrhL
LLKFEQHKYRVLDSWRGLCAILVALFHFRNEVFSHLHGAAFINNAYLFVDFFFVLSGFVIFANYEEKLRAGFGFRKFMLLRFGRVYPLHIFILSGLVALEAAQLLIPQLRQYAVQLPFAGEDNRLEFLPAQILLLHGTGLSEQLSFNFQSWTISAEFYAYALFAALILVLRKGTCAALAVIVFLGGAFLIHKQVYLNTTYEFGFVRCLYSFALGAIVWRIFQRSGAWDSYSRSRPFIVHAAELGAVTAVILCVSCASGLNTMMLPFLFAAVIWLFAFQSGVVSHVLSKTPFLFMGALSYSVYMLHGPVNGKFGVVFNALRQAFPGHETVINGEALWGATRLEGDLVAVLYLAIVMAGAVLTYYCIEMPCRNFFRRLARRLGS